jgi:trypsin-like peptidase
MSISTSSMTRKARSMRAILLAIFLIFGGGGSSKAEDPIRQEIRTHPFRVAQYNGLVGHACPVNFGTQGPVIMTARHIVDSEGEDYDSSGLRWSDDESGGVATTQAISRIADLAILTFDGTPPKRIYEIRTTAPTVGEKVYIWGMDSEHLKSWEDNFLETEVIAVRVGHIITKKSPGPGSSGSCLFDEQGRVLGINVAMVPRNGEVAEGISVGLFEPYFSVPQEVKETP